MRELKPGARPFALICMWLVSGALLGARAPEPTTPPETRLWLWAWERPEDLRFLGDRRDVGVAYLARTILVADRAVTVRPRRQPLRASVSTPLTAVVRIEVPRGVPPSHDTLDELVLVSKEAIDGTRVTRLQVDYDARASEIPYYRAFLSKLRAALPPGTWLGITAIAAWCGGEHSWLANPPSVDAVVPMVFSMGNDAPRVRTWLALRGGFSLDACRGHYGVSTAEPYSIPDGTRVVYAFSPTAFTPDLVSRLPFWNRP
jgi:hypothetical protein